MEIAETGQRFFGLADLIENSRREGCPVLREEATIVFGDDVWGVLDGVVAFVRAGLLQHVAW